MAYRSLPLSLDSRRYDVTAWLTLRAGAPLEPAQVNIQEAMSSRRNGDLEDAFGFTAEEVVRLRHLVQGHTVGKERAEVDSAVLHEVAEVLHPVGAGRAER